MTITPSPPDPAPPPHLAGSPSSFAQTGRWAAHLVARTERRDDIAAGGGALQFARRTRHPKGLELTIVRSSRNRSAALILAAVLCLAACGGDSGSDGAADPSTTTTGEQPTTSDGGTSTSARTEPEAPTGDPVPSAGCEAATEAAEVVKERHDLTAGGEERWFLLTAPAEADPVPLVIDLHGLAEGAEVHTQMSMMGELGLAEGFAVAFPQGTGAVAGWRATSPDSPDVAFVETVIDTIGAERCIDTSRVYATGLSNGAMMTSLLACAVADRIAAFAPVAGMTLVEGCDPARPVPIRTFHGTADPILFFNGGIGDLTSLDGGTPEAIAALPEADLDGEGQPQVARDWAELQGCDEEASDEQVSEQVIERTWDCPDGAAVEFTILDGQGHGWPGSDFARKIERIVGPTIDGIDGSAEIWEFFQQYTLPS